MQWRSSGGAKGWRAFGSCEGWITARQAKVCGRRVQIAAQRRTLFAAMNAMQRRMLVTIALQVSIACGESPENWGGPLRTHESEHSINSPSERLPSAEFPNLATFKTSRWWPLWANVEHLRERGVSRPSSSETDLSEVLDGLEFEVTPDVFLIDIPAHKRKGFLLAPLRIARLESIWRQTSWNASEADKLVNELALLHRTIGAPQPRGRNSDEGIRSDLRRFTAWFNSELKDPRFLAAMMLTLDRGPYCGLPDSYPKERITNEVTQRFGNGFELRFGGRSGEPIVRCVRSGKLLWSRVFSADGVALAGRFRAAEEGAVNLQGVGWRVVVRFGGELCDMYLNDVGELLFYFVGW